MEAFFGFMEFFTYILFSGKLNRYYIGATQNIEQRLTKHLQSKSGFTSRAKDWKVVYFEKHKTKSEAMNRERQIKKWKSRVKIEELIKK